jgi:L-lactate dehydrogenase complex protein LldG
MSGRDDQAPSGAPPPSPEPPERHQPDREEQATARPEPEPEPSGTRPDEADDVPEVDLAPPSGRVIPEPVRSTGAITRGAIADAAKLVVLGRVRQALADVPTAERPHHVRVTRAYRTGDGASRAELLDRFVERLADYRATVHRVTEDRLPRVIRDACRARGVKRLVVPDDLPAPWRPGYAEVLVDRAGTPLDLPSLDTTDGVVTACALAIAETGTIVLDGGARQGRRAISLVPDYHLCVVHADQVVGTVPEAVAALAGAATRPLTLISGPSATSDIELNRVVGVHGPRTLEVLLVS